jgi:hypothetical protein
MKRTLGALAILSLVAIPLHAETWKNVSIVDGHCAAKVSKDPDSHARSCALQCAAGGYGVVTAEGKFLKFDEAGSKKALEALQKSEKKDHLRGTVEGTLKDDVITVTSIALD